MKKFLIAFVLILAIVGAYLIWLKLSPNKFVDGYYLVPEDAVMVVETKDPVANWQKFSSSEMWMGLKTFPSFAEITANADMMDDLIKSNQQAFSMLGQRHLLISIHMTKARDYDFVYYADMAEASKSDIIKASITSIVRKFGYTHTVRNYMGVEINEFLDPKSRDVLSIAFVSNYLVCSFNKSLIDNVIASSADPVRQLGMNPRFTEVNQLTSDEGMCRIFINYSTFHKYLGVYMDDVADVKSLFASMFYSGFDCSLDENLLMADGYSVVNDSLSSYMQALSVSGKSTTDAESVLSERASFFVSLGFNDFNTFYDNLEDFMKQDEKAYKEQQAAIRKLEKLLSINLRKNLFDWMGSEVAIAQYETDKLIGNKVRSIMAIKARDIASAKENLAIIEKQVRKRTPIRFTNVVYKGYEIKYLEVKGLFKSIFGKMFSKIEKPYYTVLGDYVVMSDDPKTLLLTIDDFIAQRTLSNNSTYREFRSRFADKTSVMAYFSPDRHFNNFKGLLHPSKWKSSQGNQQYIRCFQHIGLSLSGDGDRMRSVFGTQYVKWKPAEKVVDTSELDNDTLADLDLFIIRNFLDNMNTSYYESGSPRLSVEMDGQVMDGAYIEYYENGVVKAKGRYNKGIKDGTWKYYKPDGQLDYKEKFKDGILRRSLLDKIFGDEGQ